MVAGCSKEGKGLSLIKQSRAKMFSAEESRVEPSSVQSYQLAQCSLVSLIAIQYNIA